MIEVTLKEVATFLVWLWSNIHIVPIALFITWVSAAGVRWAKR